MDLRTHYLALDLDSPVIAGASPLARDLDVCKQLEDHGASAIVLHSLFEEQITGEQMALHHHTTLFENAHAEALSYFPEPQQYALRPDAYLEHIRALKESLSIPVIASLNGVTEGGWTHYAALMAEAGADALELNVYYVASDPDEPPEKVEQRYVEVLRSVKAEVSLPIAMKLSPFFSAPVYTARRLDAAGAAGLVLFNRFYQPDIDIDNLAVKPMVRLSDSDALLLRVRWLAACFAQVGCSLAASGGVHTGRDAIKALMAGAHAVQMTSAVLKRGPAAIRSVRQELSAWMNDNEYSSVKQMIGSMSLARCPEPAAYERANYVKGLQSWEPTGVW
ncbi:MAG: dihydroorotate dehydrogenase-like protein [Myxococcales bacterium]|nr:dihydroorotate dehydrogenase-like protein [Myxococcales bacterium]